MLKYPKIKGTSEPDYSKKPTLKLKLPQWQGAWKCEIYDEDGNPLFPNKENHTITPLDYLKKGAMVACVIQCGGIWFTNGKFTVTWKLLQAAVQKPRASISGQCLIKLKPAEREQLKSAAPVQEDEVDETIQAQVEDSDDDEPVPPPTPVVVQSVPAPVHVEQVVAEAAVAEPETDTKPKKKIVRKKSDA
jgi:hypothetical protein